MCPRYEGNPKRRHKALTVLGGLVALLIIGSIATAAGGGGSSTQVVQGQVLGRTQAAATAFSAFGGGSGICGGAVQGTQLIAKGPSGTLLATTTLHEDSKATSALGVPSSLSSGQVGVYDFSTTIPAGSGPLHDRLGGRQQPRSLCQSTASPVAYLLTHRFDFA
jgi:hypothetical protein